MTIVEGISILVRANINDLIDRAEDPEKVIKQLMLDMHIQLLQAKTQVAAAIADEKLLYDRYQENQARATEWGHKAELAVEKEEDDPGAPGVDAPRRVSADCRWLQTAI